MASDTTQAPIATPQGTSPAAENTPVATLGFGAREYADTRRQASMQMAADEPEDINFNAVVARSQVETFDVIGKDLPSNNDTRQKMANANLDFRQKMQDRFLKV